MPTADAQVLPVVADRTILKKVFSIRWAVRFESMGVAIPRCPPPNSGLAVTPLGGVTDLQLQPRTGVATVRNSWGLECPQRFWTEPHASCSPGDPPTQRLNTQPTAHQAQTAGVRP
jgi:hypothetical protein